jgi:hypothetical protein
MDGHPSGPPQGTGGQNPAYKLTHRWGEGFRALPSSIGESYRRLTVTQDKS